MYRCIVSAMSYGVMSPEIALVIVGTEKGWWRGPWWTHLLVDWSGNMPYSDINGVLRTAPATQLPTGGLALNCIPMSELQLYTGRDDGTIYCRYFRSAVLRHVFLHQW